ncbi:MAG: hypothetical protein HUJ13_08890 [Hydrogenovibrio crunogenus]|uniref:Uncharacterized protein n=1 Tax=Hydrogenovibrio crunogenus TaxID=39765 RepID=A0A4P7NYM7_9GAMM|nr:hypothetical protein [Hydrogenovibrio crunogenus]MBD3612505.1 hypothetical protein [Hydrogenovibrio crunogenus]QBZ82748.1 hypothetical protein GHNINEIG_00784 [Hydrogenovibrio crunogenus]
MGFYEELNELKQKFKRELEVGASIQSIVINNFSTLKSLLRTRKEGSSGPFTTRQLADCFGIGYFALRGALRRAENKVESKHISYSKKNREVNKPLVKRVAMQEWQQVYESDLAVTRLSQSLEALLKVIDSKQSFLLDLEDGSDLYKMVYREKRDDFVIFDAFAKEGKSKISKQMKFSKDTGFSKKGINYE